MYKQKISLLAYFLLFCMSSAVAQQQTSAPRTLSELKSRISEVLAKPELAPALVGIQVVSLDTGKVLFEENATKLLRPASNMKLYTVATAIAGVWLGYRFDICSDGDCYR